MDRKRQSNFIDPAHITKLQEQRKSFSQFHKTRATTNSLPFAGRNVEMIKSELHESDQLQNKLNKSERLTNRIQNFRDILRCITLVFIVSMSSLSLIFEHTEWEQMWYSSYTYSLFCCLYLDLFLIYFYGVHYEGSYVSTFKKISYYLIKEKWFHLLVPLFSYTLFVITALKYKLLLFGIFSSIWEIRSIIKSIGERIFNSIRLLYIIKLLKLFLMLFFFAHSFACFWIYVPKKIRDDNWVEKYQLSEQPWSVQYVNALYYIAISMVTVGYGDIAPTNTHEKIICSILVIISCGIYGYSLNQIGVIFNELNKNSNSIQQKKIYINKFMLRKNVSENLQSRVREYLDYFWEQKFDEDSQEEGLKIIQSLNSNLRKQLIYESNNLVIRDSPIFAKNFSTEFLKKLTEIITEQKYMPEEIIYEKDSSDNNSIYFIEQGDVQVIQKVKNKVSIIQDLPTGSNFGYFSFFTGQPREFTTRSKNFSVVLKIDLIPFLEILKDFEDDHEKYYYIRDQIFHNKQYEIIDQKCYECSDGNHQMNNCPKTHYCCDRIELVKNEHSSLYIQLDRNPQFLRNKNKAGNFRSQIAKLLERFIDFAVTFDENLNKYEEEYLGLFYINLENQTPLHNENEQMQKHNFQQLMTQIGQDDGNLNDHSPHETNQESENKKILFYNNGRKTLQSMQQYDMENSKNQFLANNFNTMSIHENTNTIDETSIFENIKGRKNSGVVSISSANHPPSRVDPHSNINVALTHNLYFYQNQNDESPTQDNKALKLFGTLKSYDEMNYPLFETPVSRFSKLNIKREKSLKSFRKILTQEPTQSIRSKQPSAISPEPEKTQPKNNFSMIDTDIINPLISSDMYEITQTSRKKLLKQEMDVMKLMKIYFVRDNYNNVIQRFNTNNRYYSIYLRKEKEKSNQAMSINDQQSVRQDEIHDITEKGQLENNSFMSNNKDINLAAILQNDSSDQFGSGKLLTPTKFNRQSTINVIQQNNNNRNSTLSKFRKFIIENKLNKRQSNSYESSQYEQSENNKIEDGQLKNQLNLGSKSSNFMKEQVLDQNSQYEFRLGQYDAIQDNSFNEINKQVKRDTLHSPTKEVDLQNSDIQNESRINMFASSQFQSKKLQESSTYLSQSNYLQNDILKQLQIDSKGSNQCITQFEPTIQEQKDINITDRVFCQFDSFSEL